MRLRAAASTIILLTACLAISAAVHAQNGAPVKPDTLPPMAPDGATAKPGNGANNKPADPVEVPAIGGAGPQSAPKLEGVKDSTTPKADGASKPASAKTEGTAKPESSGKAGRDIEGQPVGDRFNKPASADQKPITGVEGSANESPDPLSGILKLAGGFAIFFIIVGVVWYFLRRNPSMKRYFGGGPIKVLSRSYLAPKFAVFLVKIGDRILIVGQGPETLSTLAEITDQAEMSRLMASIEENNPGSVSNTFKDALVSATSTKRKSESADERAPTARRSGALDVRADAKVTVPSPGENAKASSIEPGYNSQMKLAAIRDELEKAKARLGTD